MTLLARITEGGGDEAVDLNTEKIKEWRSIVTLIVFVFASEYSSPVLRPEVIISPLSYHPLVTMCTSS